MKHSTITKYMGIISMIFCIGLFIANLDQAFRNMQGVKGSIVLSIALLLNCICWVIYGLLKKDSVVWISNGVGVVTSIVVILTYFLY